MLLVFATWDAAVSWWTEAEEAAKHPGCIGPPAQRDTWPLKSSVLGNIARKDGCGDGQIFLLVECYIP